MSPSWGCVSKPAENRDKGISALKQDRTFSSGLFKTVWFLVSKGEMTEVPILHEVHGGLLKKWQVWKIVLHLHGHHPLCSLKKLPCSWKGIPTVHLDMQTVSEKVFRVVVCLLCVSNQELCVLCASIRVLCKCSELCMSCVHRGKVWVLWSVCRLSCRLFVSSSGWEAGQLYSSVDIFFTFSHIALVSVHFLLIDRLRIFSSMKVSSMSRMASATHVAVCSASSLMRHWPVTSRFSPCTPAGFFTCSSVFVSTSVLSV